MADLDAALTSFDDPALRQRLIDWIKTASDQDLFHINLYRLADQWQVTRRALLDLFIIGLHEGLFRVWWEYHCPHCGGITNETLTLHSARHEDYCELCSAGFTNQLDKNVEVFFSIHPGVRVLDTRLDESYRSGMMSSLSAGKPFVWHGDTTIHGVDLVQNPRFRELLGGETLLPDQSLEIMQSTMLFTDIRGSTRLYTELGDAKAFALVSEHFRILFETIEEFDGVAVKTIGDAVMGSFMSPAKGIEAALIGQQRLIEHYKDHPAAEQIAVKIGVHSGPTLIVTLNGRLDYFGTTVNMAARIQGVARPYETVISEGLFSAPANQAIIGRFSKKLFRSRQVFKGLDGEYTLYHIPSQLG